MTRGVTGNTSDFGSEESRFEPWRVNKKPRRFAGAFCFGMKEYPPSLARVSDPCLASADNVGIMYYWDLMNYDTVGTPKLGVPTEVYYFWVL